MLHGATGSNSSIVNGIYMPTNETANGQTVYQKSEDPMKCLYRATNGGWYVTHVADKDANKRSGWAHSKEENLAHPTLAKGWIVWDGKAWVQQSVEATFMVSSTA